jgi:hypothetical protein
MNRFRRVNASRARRKEIDERQPSLGFYWRIGLEPEMGFCCAANPMNYV